MVELKNGETYNGILAGCDAWMNVHLREAISTSRDGASPRVTSSSSRRWRAVEAVIGRLNH